MRANCWAGRNEVEVREVPDPTIVDPGDAIVRVTSTAVCGSDLHLYDGYVPAMRDGDILGHEFMGEVVETGPGVSELAVGDRVVVPFPISCGSCYSCQKGLYSLCENSNPNAGLAEKMWGHATGGIFGYSHLTGGYAGGQAEYVRVPFADVGPLKVSDELPDETLLMLADVFPTAWMGAEMCDIQPGDVVAVWGAGPIGLLAASSAYLMGAERVIVIDQVDYRLEMARSRAGAETIDFSDTDVNQALREMTGGRGPDACIDAVGMEADHGTGLIKAYDRVKQATRQETDRAHVLRQAITACKNGGTVSVVGVYGGFVDKFPIGSMMNRSLTVRTGQCHAHRYLKPLLDRVESGQIDPGYVVTHRMPLDSAPAAYETFKNKQDDCVKVVLSP